ncbi:MAG: hypothetical protein KA408_10090 [Flavobacteriales bacterium]|nr:hypothetical protein [Flavobacteriales bacterium]
MLFWLSPFLAVSSIPLWLVFANWWKHNEWWKPTLYILIFFGTVYVLPTLFAFFGVWCALIAPTLLFVYAGAMRLWHEARRDTP